MKRLYTLALSALVLAASASVAVPTVRVAKAKATTALTEHVSVVKATPSSAKRSVAKKGVDALNAKAVTARHHLDISALGELKTWEQVKKEMTETPSIEARANVQLPARPAKAKAKAPTATPATVQDLCALQFNASYSGMLQGDTGTHEGDAEFVYDEDNEELDLTLPDCQWSLYVGYENGKLTIYNAVNYGTSGSYTVYLCPISSTTGAMLTDSNIEVAFNSETSSFEFPSDFAWGLCAVNPSSGSLVGYYWAGKSFSLTVPDGDYTLKVSTGDICNNENKFTFTVTAGADIASVKYMVLPFDPKVSEVSSYIATLGNTYNAGETVTVDPVNANYSGEPMTESGWASVVLGGYDASGNLQKTASAHFCVVLETEAGWKNVGEIDYTDQLFSQYYSNFTHNQKAQLQAKEDTEGLYRIVAPYSEYAGNHSENCTHHYFIINIADPTWVEVPFSVSGVDMGDGILTFGTIAALGYTKDNAPSGVSSGTLEDQTVTFPTKTIFAHEPNYNEPNSWSYLNSSSPVTFTFPDINLNLTVIDTDNNPVADAEVALGEATATTDAAGKATVKVPFSTGYFATVKPTVNGKEFTVTLNGAETDYTATVEAQAVEVPESYAVYQNGTVGQGLNVNSWWNVILNTQDADPAGEGTVFSMTYNPNEPGGGATGPNFCAGIQAPDQSTITGPLHSATLTFQYYATTTCDITIRLDGNNTEENKTISVAAGDVNKWTTASFNVATDYPEVSAIWKAWTNTGLGDVFGVVVEQFNADTKVYFNNVVYTNLDQEWTKPYVEEPFCPTPAVPQQAAENVKSLLSGAYEAATWFNVGSWGQATKYKQLTAENNAPVAYLTDFNYLGWEFGEHLDLTDMEYMHVDFYPMSSTGFAFTPIGGGEKLYAVAETDVKVEQWNSFDVPLSYFEGVNMADVFQVKFDKNNQTDAFIPAAYIANVYFYKSAGEEPDPQPGEGTVIPAAEFKPNAKATYQGYTVDLQKAGGASDPALFDEGSVVRMYANNTLTVSAKEVTKIVFTLASTTEKRYAKLTPSVGEITPAQAQGDTEITWVGPADAAASVTFTVGEKADFGTESTKAGQVHFSQITVYGTPAEGSGDEPEPGEYTWTSLGKGKYAASVMAAMYRVSSDPVEVDVYEAEEAKGVYKFVGVWPDLEPGLELVIDATDPDFVKVPVQYTGFVDDVDGKTYIASQSALYTKEEFAEAGAESYIISMTDGCISIPADALVLNWPEAPADSEYETDPEEWYRANNCPDGYALLPGAQEPDPNEGWTSKGEATFMDGWVLPGLGYDQTDKDNWYTVELQQKDSNPNIYRLVDPYHGKSAAAAFNGSTKVGYIQFDVTDPDHVAFATNVSAGFANSDMEVDDFYCSNAYGLLVDWGYTIDIILSVIPDFQTATFKDGVVTVPSTMTAEGLDNDACFGTESGDVGYVWTDDSDQPVNMAAMIWFPGVTPEYSSITEINSAADNSEVFFNLRGQRISHPTVPGIYIRNNAKVFVR